MRAVKLLFLFFSLLPSVSASAEWRDAELNILRSLSLSALRPVPNSPSNSVSDDPIAIEFGEKIFFDPQFSANGKLSCASCHQPERYFTDGLVRGVGIELTGRNTPTIVGSAWSRWFYWDGRRDSLWSQALVPFEAANEMGSSRLAVIRKIAQHGDYRKAYESLFGLLPHDVQDKALPQHAGPLGNKKTQDDWYRLPKKLQQQLNIAYANIGKTVAAYERTLVPKATRFDLYVEQLIAGRSMKNLISHDELSGLRLFIDPQKTQCLQCHNGPLFTNNGFHNIGSGNLSGKNLDFGRMLGLQAVLVDEFNCSGRYSDAQAEDCSQLRFLNKAHHIPLKGAYKVPSLRNVIATTPYFHDGRFETLKEVMDYYNKPPKNNGPHELKPLNLSSDELRQLVAFMKMLSSE